MAYKGVVLPVFCLAALLIRCAVAPLTGGSDNPDFFVMGTVVDLSGQPAPNTIVTVVPSSFNPVADAMPTGAMIDTTNASGVYRLAVTQKGAYTIHAVHLLERTRLLVAGIPVMDDTTRIDTAALAAVGSIKISLPSTGINAGTGYIYVPGTGLFKFLDNRIDNLVLDSVPIGIVPSLSYATTGTVGSTSLRHEIPVAPEDTTTVLNPFWKYCRRIVLNTSVSGANIAGNVADFPLLVRLNNHNFDFSQAKSDGVDIRFSNQRKASLNYEIERWNPDTELADVWVKVDTVYGNDSTQYISMYWGNSNATDSSNGAAVFDTASGFQGVWHLGDNEGSVIDATINKYNGMSNGNQARIAGEIGYGQRFDGSGDYTEMGNVCNPDTSGLTICAWIKRSGMKNIQTIISKSTGGSPSSSYGWLIEIDQDGALAIFLATGTGSWGDTRTFVLASNNWITDSVWHHVAAVIDRSDGNNCRLYIDGSDVSTLPAAGDIASIGGVINSSPLRLGSDANNRYPWNGSLDECSVSYKVRSPEWVKLSYMNQREDERLMGTFGYGEEYKQF